MRWAAVALAIGVLTAPCVASAQARWIGTWGASPAPPMPAPAAGNARAGATPTFDDQTVVQFVRLSAGGERLRLRLTNEYGPKPLAIGAARVAVLGADGKPGPGMPVTFSGRTGATIPAGAPLVSDPVPLRTPPRAKLAVLLHVAGAAVCTCHMAGADFVLVSPKGDHTDRPFDTTAPAGATYRAFLSGVEVERAARGPVIVAFGDSITDGTGSTNGADRRWPDRLAERLVAERATRSAAVVNAGIAGNRVLSDGAIAMFGEGALARLDRDVLSVPGVTHMVVLEGVNDLGMGGAKPPSAEEMKAGYRQLMARARAQGIKVIGATILPYEGARYFHANGEAVRRELNAWIRSGGEFDGVIDFDAAVRDPAAPTRMRADLHAGDWLHPNDAGYRVMGDAVDLRVFR
jgi:lysophospholipase L1-like esterase